MNTDITRAQVCKALRLPEGDESFRLHVVVPESARIVFADECEVTVADLNSLAALFETFDVRVSYVASKYGGFTFGIDIYASAECDSCGRVCRPDELTEITSGHTDTSACDRCQLER